ncbi:hypothetical protein MLD38_012835 [Melastoma candidum]|uniref:Uncharacterized protein n=1 Tax=Melastoma candidum TaxID=119954 RepID=A0ACB9R715_9MYRT|nr:hypothetical protein MLD38_012835 [Melastoma candidum]
MDRYQRVEKPKADVPIDANEIRITSQGRMRSYITYAMGLLQEKDSGEIVFKAMGRAINKTVTIVELIKRRIAGIHQVTSIGSTNITDTWEPLEEGLLPIETTRHVSMITITLSKNELDTSSIGYQPPLPADQVKPHTEFENQGDGYPNGRNRVIDGRGRTRARGNGFVNNDYDDGLDHDQRYVRGRGRGRGRGFRGRGRGGYNGPRAEDQQDGEYYEEHPAQGRGFRGRGRGRYNGSRAEDQQDGEYYEEHPAQGRGFRGRPRGGEEVITGLEVKISKMVDTMRINLLMAKASTGEEEEVPMVLHMKTSRMVDTMKSHPHKAEAVAVARGDYGLGGEVFDQTDPYSRRLEGKLEGNA